MAICLSAPIGPHAPQEGAALFPSNRILVLDALALRGARRLGSLHRSMPLRVFALRPAIQKELPRTVAFPVAE
jgi:hypothetical protein